MLLTAQVVAGLLILIHIYIVVLEMFLWETPKSNKIFKVSPELAKQTKAAAANQGLYNGFLVAGLVWGLLLPSEQGQPILMFFFICIAIAGIFGALTSVPRAIFFQGIPGIIGAICLFLA